MDHADILRSFRKKPLAAPGLLTIPLAYDQAEIKRIIPHREPFLLLDQLRGLNEELGLHLASRRVDENDPVFKGHFPGSPVYPGTLQLEMIGQAGLCLYYFLSNHTQRIAEDARPIKVRATKVLGACFLEPVLPGQEVFLAIKKLTQDPYLGSVVGQVMFGSSICTVAICEVCFLE
jgi:3-hydroxyacyl-[acyl-carrier-protein] dehydratase